MSDSNAIGSPRRSGEYRFVFTATTVLTSVFILLVAVSRGDAIILALFPIAALLLMFVVDFELSTIALILVLFVDYYTLGLSSAVLFSFVLGISFVLKYRDLQRKDFANPLGIPILVYGICVLPSFFNATNLPLSLFKLLNVAGFLIVLYTMVVTIRSFDTLMKMIVIYLGLTLLNSFDVIRLSLASEARPFGFGGIWFVDYSALAICLSVAAAMVSKGKSRFWYVATASIVTLALILTRTRNTWVSAILTLSVLSVYLAFNPATIGLTRKRLLGTMVFGALLVSIIVLIAFEINPGFARRTSELADTRAYGVSQTGIVGNSLVSRLLIWDTAFEAFKAHPFIGIGVYGFPYSSQLYYRIPKFLFKLYVEGSHPHQTHLAVLAETGLLGFVGFVFLIGTALSFSVRSLRLASNQDSKGYALVSFVGLLYCTISMFFTDAWLWGQQIILLGLVAGSAMAIYRINVGAETQTVRS